MTETIHASTVAIDRRAVLIVGPSGSGKSDLALRLIDRGAMLIADDYTDLVVRDGVLHAAAPATIAGKLEVRGIGIITVPHIGATPVALLVDLSRPPERMPEPATRTVAGVAVRAMALDPLPASAPIKIELALREDLP